MPLHAVENTAGQQSLALRVGQETRSILGLSGRRVLSVLPAEVGPGGRVFVYAPVPDEIVDGDFSAEALIWYPAAAASSPESAAKGSWKRLGIVSRKGGTGSTVSLTTVDPALPVGPVMTAFYIRGTQPESGRSLTTAVVELPRSARLDFAFAVDELDFTSLAPVTLSVHALIQGRDDRVEKLEVYRRELTPSAAEAGWVDLSLGLDKLAGDEVAFEFRSESKPSAGQLETHVAWATPTLVYEKRSERRPAVILVSLGNVRAKSLGCCGAENSISPFLDRLFASEGAVFRRALTESVTSIAAHMSLLTGTSPCRHGVRAAHRVLDVSLPTLAERFASTGYATAAFTDDSRLPAELGFARGFDRYAERGGDTAANLAGRAAATLGKAMAWLSARGTEPAFVFVHLAQAEAPGSSSEYEARVGEIDTALRDFIVTLDQVVDPDRSIIAITSGHGEELGEHGARGHGTQLYEESIAIPMMLRGGGLRPGLQPTGLFGVIDLAPTLLELAGLDAPLDVEGISRAGELRANVSWGSEVRFVEATGPERVPAQGASEAPSWAPPGYAAIEGPLKLIRDGSSDRYRAYNILDDPGETRDLLQAEPPLAEMDIEPLRRAVEAHAVTCEDPHTPPGASVPLMPSTRIQLETLGYLD